MCQEVEKGWSKVFGPTIAMPIFFDGHLGLAKFLDTDLALAEKFSHCFRENGPDKGFVAHMWASQFFFQIGKKSHNFPQFDLEWDAKSLMQV